MSKKVHKIISGASLLAMALSSSCANMDVAEHPLSDEERMAWWEDARFGMFIHWGIYTIPAGFYNGEPTEWSAEWIMEKGQIPMAEYETYAARFNPSEFDAERYVLLAKNAGMKYLVITAKHHDGFAMFHSKSSPYNVVDATPFKRDVMQELSAACRKHDLRFGFYYSQAQDWHHPGGLGNTWDTEIERVSSDEYVYKKALPDVEQLLTEYGPISIFWWDTPREMSEDVIARLHSVTTELQPAIITNDRLGSGYPGHHKTFERQSPRFKPDARYWELCQPISQSWGYRSDDDAFKPIPTLIRTLVDSSSKGGNYLLNVSPMADGALKPESEERLEAIAAWMGKNNEAIYGTQASPCLDIPAWGRITMKSIGDQTVLYLHVFEWADGNEITVPLKNNAETCFLLTDKKRTFATESSDNGIRVKLTGTAPDAVSSTIVLTLSEQPDALPEKPLAQDESGALRLPAYRAQFENLQGPGAVYHDKVDCVDHWEDEQSRVYWTFNIATPGTFSVQLETAGAEAAQLTLSLREQTVQVDLPATGGRKVYAPVSGGVLTIDAAGEYEVSLMPVPGAWKPIRLKNMTLTPVD